MDNALMILVTTPDEPTARTLARELVEQRLAACAQIDGPIRSVYRWEGQLQDDSEMRVIFKTTVERWEAASEAIRRLHPYECPQIVATPLPWIEGTYGAWLSTQVEKQ